ncbi:hypothetical protein Mal52_35050 [Symmachiella dynata]|uniref:Uncharacterized protein n=1 Tax=Symmachiella dynata TaxID=2527995 RepID=A0A517ZRA7_9PLAN|nr:hypothetical protein [Symmachiella dynata]QDU45017.1 hypothetical protein Mal52_35050 [Symmachiella dynata]
MLWPIILPIQITFGVLLVVVVVLTACASPKSWGRIKTCSWYSTFALLAFIPSCTGIMMVVDAVRFGDFRYASFDDIPDFRSQRYMPEAATDIQIRKHANGYLARYKISADDFAVYLDELWQEHGQHPPFEPSEFAKNGDPAYPEKFDLTFGELGWAFPENATVYKSPREADGGGATYYVDITAGLVFQRTGFW